MVEFIWLWLAALFITFFPLWQARSSFIRLWKLMTGQVKLGTIESVSRDLHGKVHNVETKITDEDAVEEQLRV